MDLMPLIVNYYLLLMQLRSRCILAIASITAYELIYADFEETGSHKFLSAQQSRPAAAEEPRLAISGVKLYYHSHSLSCR